LYYEQRMEACKTFFGLYVSQQKWLLHAIPKNKIPTPNASCHTTAPRRQPVRRKGGHERAKTLAPPFRLDNILVPILYYLLGAGVPFSPWGLCLKFVVLFLVLFQKLCAKAALFFGCVLFTGDGDFWLPPKIPFPVTSNI
jgi:hypothetical protein